MDWYSINNEDGTQSGKWFNSSEPTVSDGGQTYNHVGKTMSGFNADGSFVYGAQDGKLYSSASLDEVTINGDQSALMTRGIHSAQNEFITSDYTKMAVGLMGGMMAGPALLEGGIAATKAAYGAILPHVPYYANECAVAYMEFETALELGCNIVESNTILSLIGGGFDGYYRYKYNFPIDIPFVISNPLFQLSSNFIGALFSILDKK